LSWEDTCESAKHLPVPRMRAASASTDTDPSGRVTDRTQDKKDLSSGDLKFQFVELSDLKVRVYGNAAVATGLNTAKGTFKGQEINSSFRFTDTWVKRNGKWQAVASQGTKVQQ